MVLSVTFVTRFTMSNKLATKIQQKRYKQKKRQQTKINIAEFNLQMQQNSD